MGTHVSAQNDSDSEYVQVIYRYVNKCNEKMLYIHSHINVKVYQCIHAYLFCFCHSILGILLFFDQFHRNLQIQKSQFYPLLRAATNESQKTRNKNQETKRFSTFAVSRLRHSETKKNIAWFENQVFSETCVKQPINNLSQVTWLCTWLAKWDVAD